MAHTNLEDRKKQEHSAIKSEPWPLALNDLGGLAVTDLNLDGKTTGSQNRFLIGTRSARLGLDSWGPQLLMAHPVDWTNADIILFLNLMIYGQVE